MTFPSITQLTVSSLNQLISAFNRLTSQIQILIDYLNGKPQLDNINLTNIVLKAGNNQVPHTLGKVLTGWTLTDNTAGAVVFRYSASNNTTLFLNSSLATTVSITVF